MKIFQRAQRAPRSPESFFAAIYKAFDESQRSPQRAPRAPFQRLTRLGHWSPPNYQLSKSKARQTGRAHLTPATAKQALNTEHPPSPSVSGENRSLDIPFYRTRPS